MVVKFICHTKYISYLCTKKNVKQLKTTIMKQKKLEQLSDKLFDLIRKYNNACVDALNGKGVIDIRAKVERKFREDNKDLSEDEIQEMLIEEYMSELECVTFNGRRGYFDGYISKVSYNEEKGRFDLSYLDSDDFQEYEAADYDLAGYENISLYEAITKYFND